MLHKLGRFEEAIASYDKAIEIKPDFHEAWNHRGYSFYSLCLYKEAIYSFDESLKIKPDDSNIWNNRYCTGKMPILHKIENIYLFIENISNFYNFIIQGASISLQVDVYIISLDRNV